MWKISRYIYFFVLPTDIITNTARAQPVVETTTTTIYETFQETITLNGGVCDALPFCSNAVFQFSGISGGSASQANTGSSGFTLGPNSGQSTGASGTDTQTRGSGTGSLATTATTPSASPAALFVLQAVDNNGASLVAQLGENTSFFLAPADSGAAEPLYISNGQLKTYSNFELILFLRAWIFPQAREVNVPRQDANAPIVCKIIYNDIRLLLSSDINNTFALVPLEDIRAIEEPSPRAGRVDLRLYYAGYTYVPYTETVEATTTIATDEVVESPTVSPLNTYEIYMVRLDASSVPSQLQAVTLNAVPTTIASDTGIVTGTTIPSTGVSTTGTGQTGAISASGATAAGSTSGTGLTGRTEASSRASGTGSQGTATGSTSSINGASASSPSGASNTPTGSNTRAGSSTVSTSSGTVSSSATQSSSLPGVQILQQSYPLRRLGVNNRGYPEAIGNFVPQSSSWITFTPQYNSTIGLYSFTFTDVNGTLRYLAGRNFSDLYGSSEIYFPTELGSENAIYWNYNPPVQNISVSTYGNPWNKTFLWRCSFALYVARVNDNLRFDFEDCINDVVLVVPLNSPSTSSSSSALSAAFSATSSYPSLSATNSYSGSISTGYSGAPRSVSIAITSPATTSRPSTTATSSAVSSSYSPTLAKLLVSNGTFINRGLVSDPPRLARYWTDMTVWKVLWNSTASAYYFIQNISTGADNLYYRYPYDDTINGNLKLGTDRTLQVTNEYAWFFLESDPVYFGNASVSLFDNPWGKTNLWYCNDVGIVYLVSPSHQADMEAKSTGPQNCCENVRLSIVPLVTTTTSATPTPSPSASAGPIQIGIQTNNTSRFELSTYYTNQVVFGNTSSETWLTFDPHWSTAAGAFYFSTVLNGTTQYLLIYYIDGGEAYPSGLIIGDGEDASAGISYFYLNYDPAVGGVMNVSLYNNPNNKSLVYDCRELYITYIGLKGDPWVVCPTVTMVALPVATPRQMQFRVTNGTYAGSRLGPKASTGMGFNAVGEGAWHTYTPHYYAAADAYYFTYDSGSTNYTLYVEKFGSDQDTEFALCNLQETSDLYQSGTKWAVLWDYDSYLRGNMSISPYQNYANKYNVWYCPGESYTMIYLANANRINFFNNKGAACEIVALEGVAPSVNSISPTSTSTSSSPTAAATAAFPDSFSIYGDTPSAYSGFAFGYSNPNVVFEDTNPASGPYPSPITFSAIYDNVANAYRLSAFLDSTTKFVAQMTDAQSQGDLPSMVMTNDLYNGFYTYMLFDYVPTASNTFQINQADALRARTIFLYSISSGKIILAQNTDPTGNDYYPNYSNTSYIRITLDVFS